MNRAVHILLVEDDDIDVEGIRRAFKKNKIANPVFRARDGVEALQMLRGENGATYVPEPRMILLDLNMPRMNGLEFLEELRKDDSLSSCVVIMLSTSSSDRDKTRAYERHIAGYIVKTRVGGDFVKLIDMLDSYWKIVELPQTPHDPS